MTTNSLSAPASFTEQTERLFRELSRAVRLNRPLIALAIYQSEFVRADAEMTIAEHLHGMGTQVERVMISKKRPDLPAYLRQKENSAETVYFVSGLRFGGGEDGFNAYRALNIRREYFIEYNLRVIFWLTEREAFNLPRYAPDFWAFRHRTVEFMESATADQITRHQGELPQRDWTNDWQDLESINAKIAYRQRLLTQLPNTPESAAARADLYYTLATLYRASQQLEKAEQAMQHAITLAKPMSDELLLARYNDELARVYENWGKYGDARPLYERALAIREAQLGPEHPSTATSLNNLAVLLESMGEYGDARPLYERALAIDEKALGPEHPDTAIDLNNLALLLKSMGEYGDARPLFERALSICETSLGTDHPHTKGVRDNLASLPSL